MAGATKYEGVSYRVWEASDGAAYEILWSKFGQGYRMNDEIAGAPSIIEARRLARSRIKSVLSVRRSMTW